MDLDDNQFDLSRKLIGLVIHHIVLRLLNSLSDNFSIHIGVTHKSHEENSDIV